MVGKKEETGIKSALELAMERMDKKGGSVPVLSAEQKEALSRVDRELQAKIAEEEILTGQQAAEARAQGDVDGAAQLEERKAGEIGRHRRRAERKKRTSAGERSNPGQRRKNSEVPFKPILDVVDLAAEFIEIVHPFPYL